LITRDTVVRLASEFRITVKNDEMSVEGGHDAVECRKELLAAFSRLPCTAGELLGSLPAPSGCDWMDGCAQILALIGAGVLVAGEDEPGSSLSDHGFGYLEPHIGMIADWTRTQLFIQAIQRVVRPGDIVLDLGTGTGVLAIAAARAGAARVYAVERTAIADVAAAMFERNGVADRITLIRGHSTAISLPERAHVLTGELLGTDPLSERILEYTADAVKRLLVPGARLAPRKLRLFGRAVELPESLVARHWVDRRTADHWARLYGMDFLALCDAGRDRSPAFTVKAEDAAHWRFLTASTELIEIDLAREPAFPLESNRTAMVTAPGTLSGIVVFWELDLDSETRLSTDPASCRPDCSWGTAVWAMADRPSVRVGQPVQMTFRYAAPRSFASVRPAADGASRP
jgi:SAM-dependent methyltransferase